MTLTSDTVSRKFGSGRIILSAKSGAVTQFVDSSNPRRKFLLESGRQRWHSSAEHSWGSGHIITENGAGRWNVHSPLPEHSTEGLYSDFRPLPQLSLRITRNFGSSIVERFRFTNTSNAPLSIRGLGIQVPMADVYDDAETSLAENVNAHIFTGGSWSWAIAQPMSGRGNLLGLIVREGELWSYSVESRNQSNSSNIRGHFVLNVTDLAHNPASFGGQPEIKLLPNESYQLTWEIAWFDNISQFIAATKPPAEFSSFSARTESSILVLNSTIPPQTKSPHLKIERTGNGFALSSTKHGTYSVDIGNARTEVNFHLPLQELVRRRCHYILQHQRSLDREGLLSYAFVPVNTTTFLTQTTNGWSDWTDGSERIAMPVLLQLAAMRGWIDGPSIDPALESWSSFARSHLLNENFIPRRGSQDNWSGPRLYDMPWLAQFFNDRYRWHGRSKDLDVAFKILERAFSLGVGGFLAIHLSETVLAVIKSLELAGQEDRSCQLSTQLVDCAMHFANMGDRIPRHEVNYEQSIVAPLLNLFIDAYTLTKREIFLSRLEQSLPWLLSFGGPQPHARLHGVSIRHWDGFWFGCNRQWGDVFPHYWSTLTSTVLLRMPRKLRTSETDRIAEAILRSNTANYQSDGSATCAFVMPSTVDGRPAHVEDPLANDQDWHLVMWLRLLNENIIQLD